MEKFDLKALLDKPTAPTSDYIGVYDEEGKELEYFDPWEPFTLLYGSYSSEFDDMAIRVLTDIQNGKFDNHSLADEMFREMLCNLDFCTYGTSPRVCFPDGNFKELLPEYIDKWKQYYKVQWNEEYEETT
jgi:hypothetical protein